MNRVKACKLGDKDGYNFWCPGCDEPHTVRTKPLGWKFNDNLALPTFHPSILVQSGHYSGSCCWCEYNKAQKAMGKEESGYECTRCHSYIENGKIQFLPDCSHKLAGTTVDLPPWPNSKSET